MKNVNHGKPFWVSGVQYYLRPVETGLEGVAYQLVRYYDRMVVGTLYRWHDDELGEASAHDKDGEWLADGDYNEVMNEILLAA